MPSTLMERIEHKKVNVKHRLNDIVDDLFDYLASELTQLAKPPPDRVPVIVTQSHLLPLQPVISSVDQTKTTQINTKVDVSGEENASTIQLQPVDLTLGESSTAIVQVSERTPVSVIACTSSSSHISTVTSLASNGPPPPVDSLLHFAPSTSSGRFSGISIHHVADDDDEEYMDEHSDSDCDCEQCMGVPICKVDIDDEHEESDRPVKRKKTLNNESIADCHDDEGEQCSAIFKTISIKCSQDDCPSMFKNKIERNQHLHYVHGILPYTCLMNDCNQSFDNVRQYGEHVNMEHKEVALWKCNTCQKNFTDQRLLIRHRSKEHEEGRFKCRKSKCNFVAPYRIDVRKHSQLHTEMYACQFGCGKSFSHTHHRKRHERIHLRVKPFRCKWPNCGYCSEARSTVIRHIRIRHFLLPLTLKQQAELGIVDSRNPRDYMEIITELMN